VVLYAVGAPICAMPNWAIHIAPDNIQLLFLLLYTSYILQPLDLAVFLSLKISYRKQVGFLSLLTDFILIGKRNFLRYYYKTKLDILTTRNIRSR
jgi:hypothetical protein